MKYVFILGRNPQLSTAEIKSVLTDSKVILESNLFLIVEKNHIDCENLLRRLGGTIKIGELISEKIDADLIVDELKKKEITGKLNFGISFYNSKKTNIGMDIKTKLKKSGMSCRLVVSKEPILSSVVVQKNKCREFMILENKWVYKTCAVQEFEEYGFRDFGRPVRDTLSGTLPPKLCKIMINLVQMPLDSILLDPFCGSGTMLQEAILLGFKNVIGSDISEKAILDTRKNLDWLYSVIFANAGIQKNWMPDQVRHDKLVVCDVKNLGKKISKVDMIVTEPYLGPALKGNETRETILKIIRDLESLYLSAFQEFKKILSANGKIVIIFPAFKYRDETLNLPIGDKIIALGFKKLNEDDLIYSRPDQKVLRNIFIFSK